MEIERVRKEFFIKDAGETIGMVGVVEDDRSTRRTIPGRRVYLQDLKIKEAFRRKGYATKLLEYVIKSYEEQGIYEITIAVDSKNEPAKKLYEKLGFSVPDLAEFCPETDINVIIFQVATVFSI